MLFQTGYQPDPGLIEYFIRYREKISGVYFPYPGFTTGRGEVAENCKEQLEKDLAALSAAGIKLCLLLNGNCYGKDSLMPEFFQSIGNTVEKLAAEYTLTKVTTASPVIARFIRKNFPDIRICASVNMEIGTPEAVEYLLDDFDCFYLKREYNYDSERIKIMRDFCHKHGKKLYILANSGCLNFCPARTFHDNLVAHQHEIPEGAMSFHGMCTQFLKQEKNAGNILAKSNFIRPEDVDLYEELCDGMKLATRTNFNPRQIVHAYFNGRFTGNLLDLTEPAHSAVLPGKIIANRKIPADYALHRFSCDKICEKCDFCKNIQSNATVLL
ncbi:MAG: hypothetical protein IKC82_07880 [Lentisphaeria bacterium]|nr:hypothetical protein [Lentisphaeria bacterium]